MEKMSGIKRYTETCVQGDPPPCTYHCPINLDIKKVLDKIVAGNFDSAYREYRNQAIFPAIISDICEQPCMQDCPSMLHMLLLERACIKNAKDHHPEKYNLPARRKRIAIIGAGLSGLACAHRLAAKHYDLTIFEREDEIGGSLKDLLPKGDYMSELQLQLSESKYSLITGREIFSLDELTELNYDAVYIATGASGSDFGLLTGWNRQSLATVRDGIFLGGILTGCGQVDALSHGKTAAFSIETWLKIGCMAETENTSDPNGFRVESHTIDGLRTGSLPGNGLSYSNDEAMSEAALCLHCDCMICYDTCEFMKEQGLMPRELEVKALNMRGPIVRVSNRLIASCTLCGHCEAVCDFDASVERAMRQGKQALFEAGGFAPAYHDFYMRDFADAVDITYLCRPAPGHEHARYLFFPGCQAAGTDPEYVIAPYRNMLRHDSDTAIILGCCGVPALYAGDMEKMYVAQKRILQDLHALSDPVVVLSCATCAKTFDEFLPNVRWISVYEYIREKGIPEQAKDIGGHWALFDPCSSRRYSSMQDAVRDLLEAVSVDTCELAENRSHALCCGQGGHIYAANPKLAGKFTEAAIAQSELPYMTYCTNCRDLFLSAGKKTAYIMDVLFDIEPLASPVRILQRYKNRRNVQAMLFREIWNEDEAEDESSSNGMYTLKIQESLLDKMDRLMISEAEIYEVIASGEASRKYLIYENTGIRITYGKVGIITIWVEYRIDRDEIDVFNAYSHRVEFEDQSDVS